MNHAIEFHDDSYPFLHITPRKPSLKHRLLSVVTGLAIIKLGKQEYAIEAGQLFWIPQGCLSSVTFLPNSRVHSCDFSLRLQNHFVTQAGYVEPSALLSELLAKLATTDTRSQLQMDLLAVVKHEVLALKPKLNVSELSTAISHWHPKRNTRLPKELSLALTVREARKKKLSGGKKEDIINEFFSGSEQEYCQLCQLVLGQTL
ncbi:AraC family transcriptional regulator [Vibrio sp. CAU 1672]|uniref:AraC family transcriptional regulator n=1 Tax=Vibrio sp. CAU 1672 TaxID=3032594 RepID=UPI0023DBAB58|nr:AraC family transcriptional regulator [Vibrio sp. CAU 1672]MDF2155154.1 AraC family transcriptional regulator [Vibrio sp. CAU 1672]